MRDSLPLKAVDVYHINGFAPLMNERRGPFYVTTSVLQKGRSGVTEEGRDRCIQVSRVQANSFFSAQLAMQILTSSVISTNEKQDFRMAGRQTPTPKHAISTI